MSRTDAHPASRSTAAKRLSRRGSFAHRPLLMLLIITMFFGGGMIPTFIIVAALGGYNSYWSLVLPGVSNVLKLELELPESL